MVRWSSPYDPGSEMIRRKVVPPSNGTTTSEAATASAAKKRTQMPPLRDSMALLFSPDKRKGEGGCSRLPDLLLFDLDIIIHD
jgi:hypothetical protein